MTSTKENQSAEDNPSEEKLPEKNPADPKNDGWKIADWIQVAIAIILAVNALVLYFNLNSLNRQIKLTEVLNEPLCAVKEIKINEVKDHANRIKIYAVITNSGNYSAKNASIEWEFYQCKDLVSNKPSCEKIKGWHSDLKKKMNITILPKQEFNYFLIDVPKEVLNKRVKGYDRGLRIKLTIKYNDMDDKPQQYSGSFLIIRVGAPNIYEATIEKSSIGEHQEELYNPSKEQQNSSTITPSDASPNVQAIDHDEWRSLKKKKN